MSPQQGHQLLIAKRIRSVVVISIVVLVVFALRLVDVQAVRAAGYASRADMELTKKTVIMAPRGSITDINGVEFARSVVSYRILVDQAIIQYPQQLASIAAPILGMSNSALESQLVGTRRYVVIAQSVKPEVWNALQSAIDNYNAKVSQEKNGFAKRLAGFFAERIYTREYPQGDLGAAVVGFINRAGDGSAGLEYSMNRSLSGVNGEYTYANAAGTIIPGTQKITVEERRGNTVRLTIDRDVQWVAQQAIADVVTKARAQSGTVIVMNPKTGAILAHATFPSFDPGQTKGVDPYHWQNPSVQEIFEPGSTGKVMTVAAAIEEGKITPETVLTVPDSLKRYNKVFHDHNKHATEYLTLTGALAVSSNTAAIQVGELLSHDKLHDYLVKFGISTKTGSGLPGEEAGKLLPVDKWSGTTAPTVAFGQGYSLTAMQATSVYATIANEGVRVTPTLIAGVSDAAGRFTPANQQKSVRVVSKTTADQVRQMLESVVSDEGTAPSAKIPGYRVAGKTGTAWRVDDSCGCYRGYTASFIGFAPADNPAYVISVIVQDPKGIHYGGLLGGPVFKKVMSFVLQKQHIPPTAPATTKFALTRDELAKKEDRITMRPYNSPDRSLGECVDFLGATSEETSRRISGICSDSRQVEIGDLFIALPGGTHHGAEFIDSVIDRGAVAVLTDAVGAQLLAGRSKELPIISINDPRSSLGPLTSWFYGNPSSTMKVLGVTGTNGKTTTTFLLHQLLSCAGIESGLIGTIAHQIGAERFESTHTTPEADALQRLLAAMNERHCGAVAMEVSSHALALHRVSGTRFAATAFTNLSQDHLDFHKTMENYFQAKRSLFEPSYTDRGLIMIDDEYGKRLFSEISIPALSLSIDNPKAHWHYTKRESISGGFDVAIRGEGGILIEGILPLLGEHNLQNALVAIALAVEAGVDPLLIGRSLKDLQSAPGRLERVDRGQSFIALVDYAHSPDAVARVLSTVQQFTTGRVIAVLGCGGDRDAKKRPLMGAALLEGSDIAIFTSDNPRSEKPESILREMTSGLSLDHDAYVIVDRRSAITEAVKKAVAGDTVIILGKGHETGQEINGIKHPFDDREVLAEVITS